MTSFTQHSVDRNNSRTGNVPVPGFPPADRARVNGLAVAVRVGQRRRHLRESEAQRMPGLAELRRGHGLSLNGDEAKIATVNDVCVCAAFFQNRQAGAVKRVAVVILKPAGLEVLNGFCGAGDRQRGIRVANILFKIIKVCGVKNLTADVCEKCNGLLLCKDVVHLKSPFYGGHDCPVDGLNIGPMALFVNCII